MKQQRMPQQGLPRQFQSPERGVKRHQIFAVVSFKDANDGYGKPSGMKGLARLSV
jgi:hypothetical protein